MSKENKQTPPSSAEDEVFVYNLLKSMGCTGEQAIAYTKIMFKLISNPILDRMDNSIERVEARLESKLDTQNTKLDVQNTKYNVLIWLLGVLVATGVLGFLANIFNWSV